MIDRKLYQETFSRLQASQQAKQEVFEIMKQKRPGKHLRILRGALIAAAEHGMRLVLTAFPLVGFQIVTGNFFQYIGKAKRAILLSMTRQMLFLVPLLIVLPPVFGTDGVWYSMPVADTLATLLAEVLLFVQLRRFRRNPDSDKSI